MSAKKVKSTLQNAAFENGDHIVYDEDYKNLAGLLNILSHQLILSLDESHKDYQIIYQYCLADDTSEIKKNNVDVVNALQYFDRCSQRVTHVVESLSSLAENLLDESWRSIDMDLGEELKKTHSFYNATQTQEMSHFIERVCELNNQLRTETTSNTKEGYSNQGDEDNVELF